MQNLSSHVRTSSSEQGEKAKDSKQEGEAMRSASYKDHSSCSMKKGLQGIGRETYVNRFVC